MGGSVAYVSICFICLYCSTLFEVLYICLFHGSWARWKWILVLRNFLYFSSISWMFSTCFVVVVAFFVFCFFLRIVLRFGTQFHPQLIYLAEYRIVIESLLEDFLQSEDDCVEVSRLIDLFSSLSSLPSQLFSSITIIFQEFSFSCL